MTRTTQVASFLAAGVLLMGTGSMEAQTQVSQSATSPATLKMTTDEEIQLLRADIRAKRKQVVAANMSLTADEATRFWPLFDEYSAEVRNINDKRWAMMKEYVANYSQMTDQQAKDHMAKSTAVDTDLIALRTRYMPQFEKLVPAKKVVQFFQIDRRLDLLMNLQLASLIPVVNPTN